MELRQDWSFCIIHIAVLFIVTVNSELNCSSLSSGNFADLNEICCAYYYTCNNGEAKRTLCPDGLYYDKKSKTCKDKEEIAECNLCYLNKNENVPLSACSSEYIFCHNTIPIRQWCFANEIFDIRTRLCTSRDRASGCLPNEFQFKNVHGLDNLCSEYDRQFKQVKEIQSCLPFFIECSNDNVRIMQCREFGTVFDDFYKTCIPKDLSFTCSGLDAKVNLLNGKEEKSGCPEKMFKRKRRMIFKSDYTMHPLYGSILKKTNNSQTISIHPNGALENFDLTKAVVVNDNERDRLKKGILFGNENSRLYLDTDNLHFPSFQSFNDKADDTLSNTDNNVRKLGCLKNLQQKNGYRFVPSNFDDEIFSADLHAKMANADLADAQFPSRSQLGNDWNNKDILVAPKTDVNEICEMIRKSCESEQPDSSGYGNSLTDETNDKRREKCNVEVTKCLQSLKSDNSTLFQQYHFPFRKLLNKLCKNGDVKFAVAPCSRFYVHCIEGAYGLKSCLENTSYNAQAGQCMPCTVSAASATVVTTSETIKCAGNFEILKDGLYEERACDHKTEHSSRKVFGQSCVCQSGYLRLASESGSLCVSENYCRMHKVAMTENKFCSGSKADFSSLVDCNEVYYRCQRNRTNFSFCNQGQVFDLAKGRCVMRQLCSRKMKPILTHLNDLCIGRKDGAYSLITNLSYPTFYMCTYEMILFSSCERGSLFDWSRKICMPMKTQDCTNGIQPKGHFEAGYSICWGGMIYETACSDGMVLKEVTDHGKIGYVCVEKKDFSNQGYPKSCYGKSDGFYLNLTSETYFFCANHFATYLNGENNFSFDCTESKSSADNESISCEISYKLTNLTSFIKRLKAEQSQSFEVAPCEANYFTKKNSAMILEKCAAGEVFVSLFQRCMKMSTDGRCTRRILCNGKMDAIYPILPCHATYYVCFGGYRYEENCPPGKVFSMHHQSCVAFLDDPSCHWNSSSLLLPAKHCSEFGNCQPVYQNCIIEGQIMNITCGDGNVYDISLKQCVRKTHCSMESYTTTTTTTTASSLFSAGTSHASISPLVVGSTVDFETSPIVDSRKSDDVAKSFVITNACKNKPNGSYPIEGNCKQFLSCSNEISYVMECPANTVYNAKIANCGHPEDVPDCQSYIVNEKLTRDVSRAASWMKTFCADKADGYYRHFNRCDQFIQCLKRRKIILSCTKGLVFNPTMKVCDLPRRVPECNIILNNLVEKESTPDDYCKGIEHGAFTKDPNNCGRFYRCVHGKAHRFDCPPNLVFNPKLNTCDWLSNVSSCAV